MENIPEMVKSDVVYNLLILLALFLIVSNVDVQNMVNDTLLSVMPNLTLKDEEGRHTMIANAIHGVIFVSMYWLIGELSSN